MNKKGIGILLIIAMGMMLAVAAQPTLFLISGWVFDANGEPCNNPSIELTNTNTGESWSAETYPDSNYYQLVINSTNVNASDVLQLVTTCGSGSSSNISNYTLTKNEISAGGLFDFNITLEEGIWVQPDLVVSGIEVHVLNNSVNATIENVGMVNITEQFNVSFSVNETTVGNKMIPHLDACNNTTVAFEWLLPQVGEYELCINADTDDEIRESNESNNEYRTKVTIPVIRVIVAIKDINETMHIKELFLPQNAESKALNITEKACDALNILFNYDGENVTIDGLVDPAVFLYNRSLDNWSSIPLDRYLDDGDIIGWSSAGDLPTTRPDLIPSDIRVTSFGSVLYSNTTNRIEATTENIGILDVLTFTGVLKANDEFVGDVEIKCLNAMNNTTVSFDWMPNRTGDYVLTVEVDPEDNISESNEKNNIITKDVTVLPISTILVPTDYPTIQDAIDNAPPNSTICIREGEYYINDDYESRNQILIKDKHHLRIIGESKDVKIKSRTGFINPPGLDVIKIFNSSHIELRGFTVEVLYKESQKPDNVRNIVVHDSNNITLTGLTFHHEGWPPAGYNIVIKIENSEYCNISRNFLFGTERDWTIYPGNAGIKLSQSNNNLVYNNMVHHFTTCLDLSGENNTIYGNNLFAFTEGKNAVDYGSGNRWNSTIPINYTYNGTTREKYIGNYWNDYNGTDSDSNGIGDVAYGIEGDAGAFDYYPLIEPYGLTFDLVVDSITRPSIVYANRNNTILASVERIGTYPTPEQIYVNLMANGVEVDSVLITINTNEHKVVRFTWEPQDVGNYNLTVDVRPKGDISVKEMNETNNELTIYAVEVSSPFYECSANMTSALDFLESHYPTLTGFPVSAWAALAVTAAGEDPGSGRWKPYYSLIDYLGETSTLNSVEDFAWTILAISAVDENPTDFGDANHLVMLKSYYDGEQFGDRDSVEDDALAILALVACGDKDQRTKKMITNASKYIKDKRNGDGGWNQFGGGSSVKTTSLAIQALIAAGDDDPQVVENALNYLKNAQEDDGGFSDVETTSYAIQAIVAAGDNPLDYTKNGTNPMDYLLSLQQDDGSFNYTSDMSFFPPRRTTVAIPALCGEPYPVMLKTIRGDYDLPDISVDTIILKEDEICVNTSYTVTADIRSNGGIFDVDLYSDDVFIQRKEVKSVWRDSLNRVAFTWKPNRTGAYNLTVFADPKNRIEEFYENNNNVTREVNVTLPDLYPSEIIQPDKIFVNATNVINVVIKGMTDESFNVTLEADGALVGERRIGGIRKDKTMSFEWRPYHIGSHTLKVAVNPDKRMKEQNFDNNILEKDVVVVFPDLVPKAITSDNIYMSATNKITVTVSGTAECFNISLVENGTVVGNTTNVTCYGKENVSVNWKPRSIGNHTITAFVDSDDDIKETNEMNNNITKMFEVLLPDIVPEDITPEVLYIDEVNTISVKVNGTAEGFNATLVADKMGVDRSGPLRYVIIPVFNGTFGTGETFFGNTTDSNLTYNITAQRANWSWKDIDTLEVSIASNTSTGLIDSGDAWSVDYVAVVVNYTVNGTIVQTLELNANSVISSGNWSNENNTYITDDEYATATEITTMQLGVADTEAVFGNITSVVIKVEQYVVNAIIPSLKNDTIILKKTNLNTYNNSIKFEWLTTELGNYSLTVFLDSDNDVVETNETNNNLTRSVIVAKRIKLKLLSPKSGETWKGVRNITWAATYEEPLLIDLFYSPDRRGYRWINITTNETNDGSYAWDTEDVPDGEYMIKVVARAGVVTEEDKSDIFYIRNNDEWGSFHQNAGYAPCEAPDTNETAWVSDDIGAEGSSSLIVAKGKIFVYCTGWEGMYSDYTYLVALDESTGEVLWGTKIAPREYGSWATPAYKDGSVYVSSGKGIYRIDADTGDFIWEFRFPTGKGSVNGGPAVTSRAVYVGDWDGCHYYGIDKNNANEIWRFEVSGKAQSVPAVAYGNVYFGCYGGKDNRAYGVDAWSGKKIWNTFFPSTKHVCGSVTIAEGIVYFTTFDFNGPGIFYALDAFNGTEIWSASIERTDSTPAYYPSRGYVYVAGGVTGYSAKEVSCFDAKTGKPIWKVPGPQCPECPPLGSWTNSPIVTKDEKVFVGKECEKSEEMIPEYCGLYCLDAVTGEEIWHSERGGSSPVVVNGFVYTIGEGKVIAFGNGTIPDLTVDANATDGRYVVGKKGNITATIENIGKSNVTESFKVELRHKGDVTAEQTVQPPLNINNSREVVFEWTPENPGEHRLTVEVDPPPGNVTESNPWNNIANVTVYVEDNKPDFVSFIEAPDTAFVGELVPVNVTIENEGYETNESFFVKFFDEGYNPPEERLISLDGNEPKSLDFTWTAPDENGTYNLMVSVNNNDNSEIRIMNEQTWTNNQNSTKVEVMPTPTPTPTPTLTPENPCYGPGSRGGYGGGSAGGIGEGSGIGEAGAGEAGGMQIPVNASDSVDEKKKEVFGFPFGNASSGASGGGGTLPLLLIALIVLTFALFYFGYYKEKRAYRGNKK